MAILSGIPVLNCRTLDETLNFYQKILQFVVVNKREANGKVSWVHLMHGDTTLMLQNIDVDSIANGSPNSNISLYFFISNIKELHHFVNVNYLDVSEVVTTDYQMQEFSLHDPEGNTVTLGQSIKKQS